MLLVCIWGILMCRCGYVWIFNVLLCVCLNFVMSVCVCMCGFCNLWVYVCVEFVICRRLFVWIF